ncbi:MAG: hypothetical protein A2X94_08575 [Bdellovibrionales bacterium GWB1_55_8]|nr:MAG: hypothetical protein A2X94_08575 [Bdellovibrionales bacterium GWB1_55_8]
MNGFFQQLGVGAAVGGTELPFPEMLLLFGHAFVIGSILSLLTWRTNSNAARSADTKSPQELVAGAFSVLFISVGMAALMILVNNSLARAFAVGAAIALVRFRVKFEGKLLPMGLFYGVLAGMACGVGRVDLAWIVALLFGAILGILSAVHRFTRSAIAAELNRPSSND